MGTDSGHDTTSTDAPASSSVSIRCHNEPNVFVNVYDVAPVTNTMLRCSRRLRYNRAHPGQPSRCGLGFYHAGIEVYGCEYSYGGCHDENYKGTGITCGAPRSAIGCAWRERISLGHCSLDPGEIADVIAEMSTKWLARDYRVFKHNCNHFCNAFAERLTGDSTLFPPFINSFTKNMHWYATLLPLLCLFLPCVIIGLVQCINWCILYPTEDGDYQSKSGLKDEKRRNLHRTLISAAEFQKNRGKNLWSEPGPEGARQSLQVYMQALRYLALVDSGEDDTKSGSPHRLGNTENTEGDAETEAAIIERAQRNEVELQCTLFLNVAACHLRLEHWTEAVRSCDEALCSPAAAERVSSSTVGRRTKALYRKGVALIELKESVQAVETLRAAAHLEPQNGEIREKLEIARSLHADETVRERALAMRMLGVVS